VMLTSHPLLVQRLRKS